MKPYEADSIRNIVIGGHSGSGKTSLAEALLFKTGVTDRLGKVSDGNTICDYDPEEIKRGASIGTSIAPLEWNDTKINLLDAPGLFDYEGAFQEAVRAAETVLVCVSARSGVKVGSLKAFKASKKQKKGCMVFVSKLDTDKIDFYKVLDDLRTHFGKMICPVVIPIMDGEDVKGYYHVTKGEAYAYDKVGNRTLMEGDFSEFEEFKSMVSEAVAETDDELMDKFFGGESFTYDEIKRGIRTGVKTGKVIPVVCGSPFDMGGIDLLLDVIVSLTPSAAKSPAEVCIDEAGKEVEIACASADPTAAFVFKTIADPFVGKMSFLKVLAGSLKPDMQLVNSRTGENIRLGKLLLVRGKKQEDVTEIPAGDVGVVSKLSEVKTGDALCDPRRVVSVRPFKYPNSSLIMGIRPKSKGDESKIAAGMQRLMEEDPTLNFYTNDETHQQVICGLGEQHLDVAVGKLKNKFGVEVVLEKPIVAYRETIRKKVSAEGKHKKQTGGHGQFGHVKIDFEPIDGEEFVFEEKVFGGSVPKGYFPAVEKGLRDSIKKGPLAGYPVVGLKATLTDGSYHPVDSSEMAFKLAANLAYKEGLSKASPMLLEPISSLRIFVPDENTGDIMGELNKRRGRVLGMNPAEDEEGMTLIESEAPTSELYDFTTLIRSVTRGKGHFVMEFLRYEPLPANLEPEVIELAKKMNEEAK